MNYDFQTFRDRSLLCSCKWADMAAKNPQYPAGTVPFSTADMEFPNPPEVIEAMKEYLDRCVLGYTYAGEDYYAAVCNWMQETQGYRVHPEEIVVTPGVVWALYAFVRMFAKEDEGVIIMPPIYGPFFQAAENAGRKLTLCPLLEKDLSYFIDFVLLEELCKKPENKLLLFCNPHNPVGRVWSREELCRLGAICKENGVVLVSDEIHSDIIMPGYKHCSMGTLPEFEDNVLLCTAPSKTFNLAALQTANIIVKNPEFREKLVKMKETYCIETMNPLGFVACTAAYTHSRPWMEQMIQVVYENYCYVRDFLHREIPQVRFPELMGTYLMWLDFRFLDLSQEALDQLMAKLNLFFTPGPFFGEAGSAFLRMNLACPKHCVVEAMERLKAAMLEKQ